MTTVNISTKSKTCKTRDQKASAVERNNMNRKERASLHAQKAAIDNPIKRAEIQKQIDAISQRGALSKKRRRQLTKKR